jgi:hypothetical protein
MSFICIASCIRVGHKSGEGFLGRKVVTSLSTYDGNIIPLWPWFKFECNYNLFWLFLVWCSLLVLHIAIWSLHADVRRILHTFLFPNLAFFNAIIFCSHSSFLFCHYFDATNLHIEPSVPTTSRTVRVSQILVWYISAPLSATRQIPTGAMAMFNLISWLSHGGVGKGSRTIRSHKNHWIMGYLCTAAVSMVHIPIYAWLGCRTRLWVKAQRISQIYNRGTELCNLKPFVYA